MLNVIFRSKPHTPKNPMTEGQILDDWRAAALEFLGDSKQLLVGTATHQNVFYGAKQIRTEGDVLKLAAAALLACDRILDNQQFLMPHSTELKNAIEASNGNEETFLSGSKKEPLKSGYHALDQIARILFTMNGKELGVVVKDPKDPKGDLVVMPSDVIGKLGYRKSLLAATV